MMLGYGLWVMGTNSAYAREGSVAIVHWPLPVRFGTSVTPSGKVVPMKNPLHSCKYSAAAGLKDIVLPEVQLSCQVRKALDVLHLQLNVLPVLKYMVMSSRMDCGCRQLMLPLKAGQSVSLL